MSGFVQLRSTPLTAAEQRALWLVLAADPALAGLPYKLETDAWGGARLSPAQGGHADMVRRACRLLEQALGGEAYIDLPIITALGIKLPDAAWCSDRFRNEHWADDALERAPEICIEVVSPADAEVEMQDRIRAYLDAGAVEVWLLTDSGATEIHAAAGLLPGSQFAVNPAWLSGPEQLSAMGAAGADVARRVASCTCGQLTIEVHGEPRGVGICHCLECQRRTGSVFAALASFAPPWEISGQSTTYTRTGDQGAQFLFRFCPVCGTTLFHTEAGVEGSVSVAVGAFADPAFPAPTVSVYDCRRHDWINLPSGVTAFDRDPP